MLTAAQISQFETQGYLVVDNVLEPHVLDAVRAEYADLLDALYSRWQAEGRVGAPERDDFWGKLLTAYKAGCDWFQPMDISLPGDEITPDTPFHFGPAVFDMLTAPRLLDHVEALIGAEITSNPIQHVRIKPPSDTLHDDEIRPHIGITDWHQDRAVAHEDADQTQMVTCWLAITDATVDNGCLVVQPQREAQQMLPHCPKTQTGIPDDIIAGFEPVPLPVKAGGAVFFHPLTPHASLPNRSQEFRWSFDVRYHVTGAPSGRSHFPSFVARSTRAPQLVLRDWQTWRSMWEDARAQLAHLPHIPIHRWTSDSPYCA